MTPRTVSLRAFLTAIGGLTVVFALVVVTIVRIDQRNDRERAQEELDTNFLACLRGNELRQVNLDNEREPGAPLDLSILPSVQDAPEWFQDVVVELRDASAAIATAEPDPDSRAGRRIARLEKQIRDCETEWAGHTPGLRLKHETTPIDPEGTGT